MRFALLSCPLHCESIERLERTGNPEVLTSLAMHKKPTTIIRVAKPGQPSVDLTLEEVNQRLAGGHLSPSDQAWHEGLSQWIPLARIRGVEASPPVRRMDGAKSPPSVWGTIYDSSTIPTLWNPLACGLWSLLFTPLFGATLVARNWHILRREDEAHMASIWIWLTLALLAVPSVLFACQMPIPALVVGLGLFLLSVTWFATNCARQIKVVRAELNNEFFRARWTKPLLLAAACLIAYIGLFFLVELVQTPSHTAESPPPATQAR